MRWMRRVGIALGGLLALLLAALGLWALVPAGTADISGEHAVAQLERLTLGGVEQGVLLRGHDRRNPVLLYVHGGPGFATMPLAPVWAEELERHFVVVQWDQRGAGASCGSSVPASSMNLEQIVADALELSAWLAERFGQQRIVLLGHSWGSIVGTLAVQRRPELFHAYVGLGQVVHGLRNEQLSYDWVVSEAERRADQQALEELASVHPPYAGVDDLGVQRRWLMAYRGSMHRTPSDAVLRAALFGREYTLGTRLRFFPCFNQSIDRMWGEVGSVDFFRDVPRLEVPVFLPLGRHDWNTPYPLAEEWAAALEAPSVEVIWFEESAHMALLEEPGKFQRVLVERVRPVALEGAP